MRLLTAWPAPNTGTSQYQNSLPSVQDTRQEVVRMDWQINNRWRLMGRYTHDLSETTEAGGLFFNTPIPNIATTLTDVPGQVFVAQLTTTLRSNILNEVSFQFSGNAISSAYGDNAKNKRADYGLTIPELFAENRNSLIPSVAITGLSSIGAPQLFDNKYRNYTIADNLSWQRANHSYKMGFVMAFEQKDELSGSGTQGSFSFGNTVGGRTGFQSFLTGNRDGACGNNCTYTEPAIEIASEFRFNRYEFYVQDSWRLRSNVTLDYGLRYGIYPAVTDKNDVLTNFVPSLFSAAQAPALNAAGSVVVGTGDPLNGIVVAGQNSPYGRGIYQTDKNNFQPRVGLSWDTGSDGKMVMRAGYGIYYDQPLIGIFLQNAFVNPPFVADPQVLNAQLSNPGAGSSPTTRAVYNLIASSDPFETPRTQQWNVGVQRQLYARGMVDVGYVGSAGDNLIQPVQINQPQPQDVVRVGVLNAARPYTAYGNIQMRQTTAKSRYNGLLVSFRHDQGRAGLLSVAYTLSQTKTDATNDRDAVDVPQNPLDLGAEYAIARTDRTHVLTFNYVYELPFFREADPLLKATLGGWQVSGITQMWTGPPISRVVNGTTNGSRRGIRVDQVSDPLQQPAGRHRGRRVLTSTRSPSRRRPTAPTGPLGGRSSGCPACTSGTSRCRRTGTPTRTCGSSSVLISSTPSTTPSSTPGPSRTSAPRRPTCPARRGATSASSRARARRARSSSASACPGARGSTNGDAPAGVPAGSTATPCRGLPAPAGRPFFLLPPLHTGATIGDSPPPGGGTARDSPVPRVLRDSARLSPSARAPVSPRGAGKCRPAAPAPPSPRSRARSTLVRLQSAGRLPVMRSVMRHATRPAIALVSTLMLVASAHAPLSAREPPAYSVELYFGPSGPECEALGAALKEAVKQWSQGGKQAVYDPEAMWSLLPPAGWTPYGRVYALADYIRKEDGLIPPMRTGKETALYNAIKAFAKDQPSQALDYKRILEMALTASADGQGRANISIAMLTAHNIVRALARPKQWWHTYLGHGFHEGCLPRPAKRRHRKPAADHQGRSPHAGGDARRQARDGVDRPALRALRRCVRDHEGRQGRRVERWQSLLLLDRRARRHAHGLHGPDGRGALGVPAQGPGGQHHAGDGAVAALHVRSGHVGPPVVGQQRVQAGGAAGRHRNHRPGLRPQLGSRQGLHRVLGGRRRASAHGHREPEVVSPRGMRGGDPDVRRQGQSAGDEGGLVVLRLLGVLRHEVPNSS